MGVFALLYRLLSRYSVTIVAVLAGMVLLVLTVFGTKQLVFERLEYLLLLL
jgi:hypothetical protein